MDSPKVAIVILNWNGLALTKKCLLSVSEQTYANYQIITIDNGSTDGSQDWLKTQQVTLIENKKNLGFARAINQGFSKALGMNATYVISLNNDVELDKNWLKSLVSYMEKHRDIGFAQGASMQASDHSVFDSSGIYLEKGFIPNQRASGLKTPSLEITAIGPNAAGAIYRVSMLKNISYYANEYFDSRFFAYVEDVDFNLRCSARGYRFAFVEAARMYHIGSATGNRVSRKKMFWGARNMIWLVYKNTPLSVFRECARIIFKSHLANLQYLRREQPKNYWPYFWGLTVGVLGIPLFINKRRQNMKMQTISSSEFLALLVPSNPPLKNPFRNLKKLLKYK